MVTREVEIIGQSKGRLCVLNCLDTPKGVSIKDDMLSWLVPLYRVHVVCHDGTEYEQDGLRYMKELMLSYNQPCLYLQTKGACRRPVFSRIVRNMWRCEFGDEGRANMYFDVVRDGRLPVVACPFTDGTKVTRYNGFVVNVAAIKEAVIEWHGDRWYQENLWEHNKVTDVRAMKYWGSLGMIHKILEIEYGQ